MNDNLHSALVFVGICAMMGATVLIIFELWFEGREPNIVGRIFETGLACLGLIVGCHLINQEQGRSPGG